MCVHVSMRARLCEYNKLNWIMETIVFFFFYHFYLCGVWLLHKLNINQIVTPHNEFFVFFMVRWLRPNSYIQKSDVIYPLLSMYVSEMWAQLHELSLGNLYCVVCVQLQLKLRTNQPTWTRGKPTQHGFSLFLMWRRDLFCINDVVHPCLFLSLLYGIHMDELAEGIIYMCGYSSSSSSSSGEMRHWITDKPSQ